MKPILMVSALCCVIFAPLRAAQEIPTTEVFGGYSVETLRSPDGGCLHYNGWNASVARRVLGSLSLVADFGGHYGRVNGVIDNHVHTFLTGPRLTLHNGRIAPFVHALLGVSRLKADAGGPVLNTNAFTLGLGGGVDLKVTSRWSIRCFQIDYLRREFFGEPTAGGRISGGVVFHFGR